MVKPEKTAVVEEIRTRLGDSDAAVLTEYRGLGVRALAGLRVALRPVNTEYKVFKVTLARRAAEEAGLTDLLPLLEGPVAFAFVRGDVVPAAKALRDFGRTNPELVVKGGLLGTRPLTPAEITELADIPPRDQLLGMLAGGFQAPLTTAAGLFQAFTRNLAYGVQALIDQRAANEPAAPAESAETPEAPEPPAEPVATSESSESAESESAASESSESSEPTASTEESQE